MQFMGYLREDGKVGTRNWLGVFSTVSCVNEVVERIVNQVEGTVRFTHQQGCCQTPMDIRTVTRILINLGENPNIHSVLLISLGCESTDVSQVARDIRETGKRVEVLTVQELGGSITTIAKGIELAKEMVREGEQLKRQPFCASELVMGMKCGSSDTTSGLAPNPVIGVVSDQLTSTGGTSVLGEVTEFIGAEHILIQHSDNNEVAKKILQLVEQMEQRAMSVGEDIRGGQPTQGNILGGLTTIEEKSLGAIAKAGTSKIMGVYEYGEIPDKRGLVVMDSPGREPEILTGLAAAGCNVILFATGRGAPQGFPFVPVIKVTGSHSAMKNMSEHMDVDVSTVINGEESIRSAGDRLMAELLKISSGAETKAEILGYTNSMDIYMKGPVI